MKNLRVPGIAAMLFLAFLSLTDPAHADGQQGQRDCANLRIAVLQLVGARSKELLFASRDMSTDGWLDANVAHSAFKDVQLAVMYFDFAYEVVPKTPEACRDLTFRFGTEVGSYIEEVMETGQPPSKGRSGVVA